MQCKYRNCKKQFKVNRPDKQFCSEICRRREYVKNLRTINKLKYINLLGGKCSKCGYNKCIDALQFHHKNPKHKELQLSKKNLTLSNKRLIKEIKKCILLCSNCHIEHHFNERQE